MVYETKRKNVGNKKMIERLRKLDLKIEKAKEICRIERIKLNEKKRKDYLKAKKLKRGLKE